MKDDARQLQLLVGAGGAHRERITAISAAFDPSRLTQARRLGGLSKRAVADAVGVSPAAVSQWESGAASPRAEHIKRLAALLEILPEFLSIGRRYVRLELGDAHFRSLRSTPAALRAKAVAFTEQVWELTHALEKRVQLPEVALPGFAGGEVEPGKYIGDPIGAAAALRKYWCLGDGPVPHLVRTMERNGLVVTLLPFAGSATGTVDAFSTSHLPRPMVILTPDRADDVYRHRFTAAHELGHLVLHGETAPGDPLYEAEADAFAAEFLTPTASIRPQLPSRLDLHQLERLGATWGISVESLVYRCHEIGAVSESTYRRAFQRLHQLRRVGLFGCEPVTTYPGERPALLNKAFMLAEQHGLTLLDLARQLCIKPERLRFLLGVAEQRPILEVVR